MTVGTRPSEFVTDTMGLVLRVERRRLGPAAKAIFEALEAGDATVYVPALVFAEVLYLAEKRRISSSLSSVASYLSAFPSCREYPMNYSVVESASSITDIPELHDRLISATGRLLGLQVITNDPIIQSSKFVKTVW